MGAPVRYRCPLQVREPRTNDDGNDLQPYLGTCEAPLHLEWSFMVPLDTSQDEITAEAVLLHQAANAWQVVCENGHTVAVSYLTAMGQDYAEEWTLDTLAASCLEDARVRGVIDHMVRETGGQMAGSYQLGQEFTDVALRDIAASEHFIRFADDEPQA